MFVCNLCAVWRKRMYDAVMIIIGKTKHPPHHPLCYIPLSYFYSSFSSFVPLRGKPRTWCMLIFFIFQPPNPPFGCTFLHTTPHRQFFMFLFYFFLNGVGGGGNEDNRMEDGGGGYENVCIMIFAMHVFPGEFFLLTHWVLCQWRGGGLREYIVKHKNAA